MEIASYRMYVGHLGDLSYSWQRCFCANCGGTVLEHIVTTGRCLYEPESSWKPPDLDGCRDLSWEYITHRLFDIRCWIIQPCTM